MEVTIASTTYQKVKLTDEQVRDAAELYLMSLVRPGEYLRDVGGTIQLKYDDPDHRHGSISELYVRDATPLDIAVFGILHKLRSSK